VYALPARGVYDGVVQWLVRLRMLAFAVCVLVASQALGDVVFARVRPMDLADTLEGVSEIGAIATADKSTVGWRLGAKRGRQE
jgi:hypothetical protein